MSWFCPTRAPLPCQPAFPTSFRIIGTRTKTFFLTKQICFVQQRILHEGIEIPSSFFLDGVAGEPPAVGRGVVAVVVIDEAEFGVVNFGRPLEGLRDVARRGNGAEGRVVVARADVAGGSEDFPHVLRDVVPVGEPRAVLLDRERARRGRFFGIPEDHAFERERFRSRGVRSFRLPVCHFSLCNSDSMEIQHKQDIHTIKMHPSVIPAMRRCTLNLRPLST